VILLLDTSASMGAAAEARALAEPGEGLARPGGEGSLLQRARQKAHAILDLLGDEDRVLLIFVSDRPDVRFEAPLQDVGRAHREVDRAALSMRPTDFASAFEAAYPHLAEARTLNREIYVISDFQAAGWPAGAEEARPDAKAPPPSGAAAPEKRLAVPAGTHVYLVPVTEEAIANVAVSSIELAGEPASGGADRVLTEIRNFAHRDLSRLPVKVLSGGGVVGEALVDIERDGAAWAEVPVTGALADGGLGEARIPADRFPLDDARAFVGGAGDLPRVLVVRPPGEGTYFELALNPAGGAGPFRAETVDQRDLGLGPAPDADVIVLLNVDRLTEAGLAAVSRFASEGGGVLAVLGDRTDIRYYNTTLLPRLLPVTLRGIEGDPADPERYFSLAPKAVGHRLFAGFRVGAGERLTGSRFFRVVAATPGEGTRVLAEFGPGLPAILEGRRAILVTTSFDQRWNNFATSGAFLPLVHRLVGQLAAGGRRSGGYLVGERLETVVPLDRVGPAPFCRAPDGRELPVAMTRTAAGALLSFDDTAVPGVYTFVSGTGRLAAFAVNLDASESDLTPARLRDIESLVGESAAVVTLRADAKIERAILEARHGRELWRPLLAAALALMIVEILVGRSRGEE
jgi:hypothetical protein